MNTTPRNHPDHGSDDREWQLQERALHDERHAAATSDDPALARYRQVVRALRQPLPPALPADFATRVATCAGSAHAPLDTRLEQAITGTLMVLLAVAACVAFWLYGDSWLHESLALLPRQAIGFAMNWGVALAACIGLSWSLEQLRAYRGMHRRG